MSEDPSVKLEIDQRAFDYVNDQVNQLADTIEQDEEAKAQVAKQEQPKKNKLSLNKMTHVMQKSGDSKH